MALARLVAVAGYRAGRSRERDLLASGFGRREYRCYFYVGAILTLTSILYIIYCQRLFLYGDSSYYSEIVSIAIAAITFGEIGLAVYGIQVTRKYREPAVSAIKLTNLASSLISLVLTQTAILSFTHEGEVSFYNGLAGVLFGAVSALIGVGMMVHASRMLAGRVPAAGRGKPPHRLWTARRNPSKK